MAAKKCLICSNSFSGRRDAKTCSMRCRKRLQLLRQSFGGVPVRKRLAKTAAVLLIGLFGFLSVALGTKTPIATAATSDTLNFQARLLTSTGAVVPDGNYHIEFKIYDSASSNASAQGTCSLNSSSDDCWWMETRTTGNLVRVVNGYFNVNLGSVTAFGASIPWDQPLWLTMNIGGTGGAASWDGEMLSSGSRIKLTGVPYAFRAGSLAKNNGTQTGTLSFNTVANSPVITLPDATGTVCLTSGNCVGVGGSGDILQNGNSFTTALTLGTNDNFGFNLEVNNTNVVTLSNTGQATFKNTSNSTTAFQVQNAAAASLLNIDTTNSNITLLGNNSGELKAWQTNTNTIPAERFDHSSASYNGYVYVLGGENDSFADQSGVYYAKLNADGSTGTWSTNTNSLPAAIRGQTTVVSNGYIYTFGGYGSSAIYYAKLNNDGSTGAWTTSTRTLPAVRYGATSVVANGYVYVMGGYNGTTTTNTDYYAKLNADGTIGVWNSTTVLPVNIYHHASVAANGYVYILGGDTGSTVDTVYYAKLNIDGTVGSWTTNTQTLPSTNQVFSVAVANGYIYEIGGPLSAATNYAKLNADGSVGSWSSNTGNLPLTTQNATTIVANGYVYVMGGYDGTNIARNTVYYASVSRLQVGGALDLVGLSGENLSEGGSGGELTAGNTNIIGALNVQGAASFQNALSVEGTLNVNGNALLVNNSGHTNNWQTGTALGVARGYMGTAYANGYAYLVGGTPTPTGFGGSLTTVEYAQVKADGSLGSWTATTSLPQARAFDSVVTANGYLYVVGGASTSSPVNTVYYAKLNNDGTVGSWQTATNTLPGNRYGGITVVNNGYIYMVGGNSAGGVYTSTVLYAKLNADGSTGAWQTNTYNIGCATPGCGSPVNVSNLQGGVVANGYFYTVGGSVSGTDTANVYYTKLNADGSTGAWATTSSLPQALNAQEAVVTMNGYIYSVAGIHSATSTELSAIYYARINNDGTIGSWQTDTSTTPTALHGATGFAVNGRIYTFGGNIVTTPQTTVMYGSSPRLQVGGSLDLVGPSGENLADPGAGGSLTAGNTNIIGDLTVAGSETIKQSLTVGDSLTVNGSAQIKNTVNSPSAFQIQNASGVNNIAVTTVNLIANTTFESGITNVDNAVTGWSKKLGSETSLKNQASNAQFGTNSMELVTTTTAQQGAKYSYNFLASTQYTLSFYAKVSSGSFATLTFGRTDTGAAGGETNCVTTGSISTTYRRSTAGDCSCGYNIQGS
jgi:N-acetylneuraminic acid mutarotase